MFNRPTPGEDAQVGPARQVPELPPLRTFKLTRYSVVNGNLTVLEFRAHEMKFAAQYPFVWLIEYVLHPQYGPTQRCVFSTSNFMDVEEILDSPVEPSRIIAVSPGTSVN